jgi:hypothetical protein
VCTGTTREQHPVCLRHEVEVYIHRTTEQAMLANCAPKLPRRATQPPAVQHGQSATAVPAYGLSAYGLSAYGLSA